MLTSHCSRSIPFQPFPEVNMSKSTCARYAWFLLLHHANPVCPQWLQSTIEKLAIYSQPHKHVGEDKVVLGSFSDGDFAIQICSLKFCDCHRWVGSAVLTLGPRLFQIWIPVFLLISSFSKLSLNPADVPFWMSHSRVYYLPHCNNLLRQRACSAPLPPPCSQ